MHVWCWQLAFLSSKQVGRVRIPLRALRLIQQNTTKIQNSQMVKTQSLQDCNVGPNPTFGKVKP